MSKIENLLGRLARVRRTSTGWKACCSYHAERTPSLFINVEDNKILLRCFGSGCKAEQIVKAVGLEMSDLFLDEGEERKVMIPAAAKGKKYKSIEEIKNNYKTLQDAYTYNEIGEEPSHLQIRFLNDQGKKDFHTYHRDGDFWYSGKGEGLTPLYNMDGIQKGKSVLIVEGEKVVNILKEYNIPATTSLGGANNAHGTDWTYLKEKQSVVSWRDFNEAGLNYENDVDKILSRMGVNLRKVEVDKLGLEEGDDLEQFIEKNQGTVQHVQGKIYSCIPKLDDNRPVSVLRKHLNKIKSGEIKNWNVPFFPMLTKFARAFKPGTQTVIVSAGGVGKSLFIGRMSDELVITNQARVKRLHLESDLSLYMKRSWCQQARRPDVLNEEFHYDYPDESDQLLEEYEDVLDIIGRTITTVDSGVKKKASEWSAEGVMDWMKDNAKDSDILIIDPISMVLDTKEPWKTSSMLTKHAEDLMSKHPHLCVVWIQHTAESPSGGNIGGISGGKAWNRFSSSILELIALEDPEKFDVRKHDGTTTVEEVQTYIKIKKARNGAGSNWKIGMYIDKEDVTYKEMGRLIRKNKG